MTSSVDDAPTGPTPLAGAERSEIPSPASRLVVAAAVLDSLSHPTTMLCTARSYPAEHAGQYELPGGKVETGETPTEALARELREEIDLEVRLGEEVRPSPALAVGTPAAAGVADPSTHPGDDAASWPAMHGYRMRVWLAEPADPEHGPRRGTAHESMSWVPLDDVAELPWLPADLPILAAIREAGALAPSA